eukprot:TRINITY_DN35_c0_g1_i1.p1 TRINITY_DN35_c0_g1~~TRINITY_DN35_c0_g1_i1.p1  ORF type:complete len:535 (-),score=212.36 TRINITY_DN35_c0_g1_i1:131-1735(-)
MPAEEKKEKKDVEMKEEGKEVAAKKEEKKEKPLSAAEKRKLTFADLLLTVNHVDKTATTRELRFVSRVLRRLPVTRKTLTVSLLKQLIEASYPVSSGAKDELLSYLTQSNIVDDEEDVDMISAKEEEKGEKEEAKKDDEEDATTTTAAEPQQPPTQEPRAEVDVYLHLLVVIFLIDHKSIDVAVTSSTALKEKVSSVHRQTIYALGAKAYFYYSRCYEITGRLVDVRSNLLAAFRTATLRHDDDGQAVLLHLLLRNYLHYNLYEQADKLLSKVSFPDSASSNQLARFLFYQGRIRCVQLDYTESYKCLQQAIRKAPEVGVNGFRRAVYKLACIVQLLMGEIPERAVFRQPGLKQALRPYFLVVQAVRVGDVGAFTRVINTHAAVFKRDKNFTLVQRIRHNVIKTGLRKINLSYSRIHLSDICAKLNLDSVEDAEFIVTKAIRDGVIDATIDHEGRHLSSTETTDIYSTQDPLDAFHKRISFCLNIHNEAVKAMRFPAKSDGKAVKAADEARKEHSKQVAEVEEAVDQDEDDEEL